jgi:hypothetical protein
VNDVLQIVSRLEQAGGKLSLKGDRVEYAIPKGNQEAQELLAKLREHREGVTKLLQQRVRESGERWPLESEEQMRKFGQPHARLFPFIGRKVRTPAGPGTLIQVFAHRVTVLLDSELSKCTMFTPDEIVPCDWTV